MLPSESKRFGGNIFVHERFSYNLFCQAACKDLNKAFIHRVLKKIPYSMGWGSINLNMSDSSSLNEVSFPSCKEIMQLLEDAAPDTDAIVIKYCYLDKVMGILHILPKHIDIVIDATDVSTDLKTAVVEGNNYELFDTNVIYKVILLNILLYFVHQLKLYRLC